MRILRLNKIELRTQIRSFRGLLLLACALFLLSVFPVYAQTGNVEIAKTYTLSESEEVQSGDIVSFNPATQQMTLSRAPGDRNTFGIVVFEPLLVLSSEDVDEVPVVRTGEAAVNVTAGNGSIEPGDFITTSSIAGKGIRADESHEYIVGVALEPYSGEESETGTISQGQIQVLLNIGTREQAIREIEEEEETEETAVTGISEATILNIIQYLLAAFIAVGSIYVAFKNFGPALRDGITSIGRNPLARSSIQSVVILNAVIIVLISAGGLLVSIAILLLPI